MTTPTIEDIKQRLRQVIYPGFDRDIVAFGFVKDIEILSEGNKDALTIHFSPNTRVQGKVAKMEADIRAVLSATGEFDKITIRRSQPFDTQPSPSADGVTPLQAELMQAGVKPEPDMLSDTLPRADMAPEVGYGEEGPTPLQGQVLETYEGVVPVYQWDIDPQDTAADSNGANVELDGWDYRMWWQAHPAGLVYASLQAMSDDTKEHGGAARSHPVGRSEAVNLVYDLKRQGIVAIYGTVKDFRPFVEAFREGYGIDCNSSQLGNQNSAGNSETVAKEAEGK